MGETVPYTGELDVSPWDALLSEVRRAAYRAAWIDERINVEIEREREAYGDDEAEAWDDVADYARHLARLSGGLREWLDQSRKERAHMATVARNAVAAGLSERYIESVQTEARMIAGVLTRALDAAELTPEQRDRANAELRVALADVGRELRDRHSAVGGSIPERPSIES